MRSVSLEQITQYARAYELLCCTDMSYAEVHRALAFKISVQAFVKRIQAFESKGVHTQPEQLKRLERALQGRSMTCMSLATKMYPKLTTKSAYNRAWYWIQVARKRGVIQRCNTLPDITYKLK